MNGWPIFRAGQAEQSPATKLFEPERKLGLANPDGNVPTPGLTSKQEADFKIVYPERRAGKQPGETNNFGRGLLDQNGYSRKIVTESEKLSHHLTGSLERHQHALKDIAHHLAIAQDSLPHITAMSGSVAVRKISRGVVKITRGCFSKTGAGPLSIGPRYYNSPIPRSATRKD
ncbi:MAG: hypothetical protein WB528_08475 [Bradyrhizobium sp.]